MKKGEKYSFNELLPVPDSLKPIISGPVYMHGDTTHHFSEVAKKVDGLKDLSGEYPTMHNHNDGHSYQHGKYGYPPSSFVQRMLA